jgi:hypothetical protein
MAVLTTSSYANDMLGGFVSNISSGGTSYYLDLYTGSAPASPSSGATGTNLSHGQGQSSSSLFNSPSGSPPLSTANTSGGNVFKDSSAANSGTAGYFRINDNSGNCVLQGSVTATGGGGDLTLNSTTITAGASVSITSFSVSLTGVSA